MNAGARVAAFVVALVVLFAGAALTGRALDPDAGDAAPEQDAGHAGDAGEHAPAQPAAGAGDAPAGVASAQDGHRLVVERTRFQASRPASLRFRILDDANTTVRDFELEQARRMHLIVVRRDLRRYQHLHPVQGADGSWATELTLPDAGVYRAFADFRRDGEQHTLGVDLFVPGDFMPLDLPAASERASTGGYDVALRARGASELSFTVSRDGRPVADLEPYLGARGHLVVLREGDLAYRHVHPAASTPPAIAFDTGAREPGTYRLFLQFRHEGRVRTAAFTRVVEP
jgi:hypothetical protein